MQMRKSARVCYDTGMAYTHDRHVVVIGGGLAGCEAAWQLAERGLRVRLYEMRPRHTTPAHKSAQLAELVCSNSLKSLALPSAAATLKHELALMGSPLLKLALKNRVEAGMALAVERNAFAKATSTTLTAHPNIELVCKEVTSLRPLLDDVSVAQVIVATGPLTSDALAADIAQLLGKEYLAFFDAAAPIVEAASLDKSRLVRQLRFDKGEGEYLNALLSKEQYLALVDALVQAERVVMRDFERRELFSACQPVEEVARSGTDALRYGALKPIGLHDPTTARRPYAAVQLRAENREQSAWNLVGFQTNLSFAAQERVLRLIPGLEQATFVRYGVMHRNTFINAPASLGPTLELSSGLSGRSGDFGRSGAPGASSRPDGSGEPDMSSDAPDMSDDPDDSSNPGGQPGQPKLRFAGQITGTEGYTEAIASGLYAALNCYALFIGAPPVLLPKASTFGALLAYVTSADTRHYQPMHVNYGLMPPLVSSPRSKRERYAAYSQRALTATKTFMQQNAHLAFLPSYELPSLGEKGKEQ
jgi:methylenetetrahydrofolate--tRNA-(uracil-5-)-methyltransferase